MTKVWYLREMDPKAVVNVARQLLTLYFAPGEETAVARALYIMRKGVCSRRGKVHLSGDVWGEDMVLHNPYLRDQAPVRAVSYVELLMLRHIDLEEAIAPFPEVKAAIRKVQVKIAITRAIILIARMMQELAWSLEAEDPDAQWELTNQDLVEIVRVVLSGGSGVICKDGKAVAELVADRDQGISRHSKIRALNRSHSKSFELLTAQANQSAGTGTSPSGDGHGLPSRRTSLSYIMDDDDSSSAEDLPPVSKKATVMIRKSQDSRIGDDFDEMSSNSGSAKKRSKDSEAIRKLTQLVTNLAEKVDGLVQREQPANAHRVY